MRRAASFAGRAAACASTHEGAWVAGGTAKVRAVPGYWLLPFLLALAGTPAVAQPVTLRAGEHDDFTRLVLRVPESSAWALLPAPGGFELRGPDGVTFDATQVFGRIPRDRITALASPGEGRLAIGVACDCHGQTFWEPEVGLVVDVIDGPAPPGSVEPGPVPPARPASRAFPLLTAAPPLPVLPGAWDAPVAPPPEAARVAGTEAAILDSVAEAARHGFLDLAPGVKVPTYRREEADRPFEPPADSVEVQPGLALRTGAQVIAPEDRETLGATGTPCIPDSELDLASWIGSDDFGTEMSARILAVSDDRDVVDPAATEALARAYLAFGFGREASVALDVDGRSSRGRDVLRSVAHLLDGEPVAPAAFDDQGGCLGPVALWRALARGTLGGTDERERTAITLAFQALPEGARNAVALRLAGLFLDTGDSAAAQAIAGKGGAAEGDAVLARAEIAEDVAGPDAALAELEEAADRDPRMTPEAMVQLLDLMVNEGRPVGDDLLELARALRFEHGGSRDLLLAEGRALSADGRFEEALALLVGERAEAPGADLDAALATTVEALAIEMEDGPFLELALGGLPDDLPPEAAEAVARRLSELGFPDEAWALRMANDSSESSGASAAPAVAEVVALSAAASSSRGDPLASSSAAAEPPQPSLPAPAVADGPSTSAGPEQASATAVVIPPPPPMAESPDAVASPGLVQSVPATTPPTLVAAPPAGTGVDPAMATGPVDLLAAALPASSGLSGQANAPGQAAPVPVQSLADRRAVLDQAEDARARAAALLGQALPE